MSLSERIQTDFKLAMKAKDQAALRAHRAIKSAILIAKTEKGGSDELAEEDLIKILQKLVKQREDSIAIFKEQKREDLAITEEEEVAVISNYLPKQLSDAELEDIVKQAIEKSGASSKAEMGKAIGIAMQLAAGRADGKRISQQVAKLL